MPKLLECAEAPPAVREVFDDIMRTRGTSDVNNFWKALAAVDPELLRQTWERVRTVMAPGALDPLTKELIYIAVSIAHGCEYCIASHTAAARAKGMTAGQYAELLRVVATAAQTNRLASALRVPVDPAFDG